MLEAEKWFKEKIKDLISVQYQAVGGFLDGTMMGGDEQAGTYKFPKIGRLESYQITSAIQDVGGGEAALDMISVSPTDWEASAWLGKEDIYKMGPNAQAALAQLLTYAIARRRDYIKLQALADFTASTATQDIGDSSTLINPFDLETARAEIAGTGADDMRLGSVFCALPEMWMSQLCQYKEWARAEFKGSDDLPWAKSMRERAKTVRGVHYFTMPDEYFTDLGLDNSSDIVTFMWARSAMGAETPWNQEAPEFQKVFHKEGSKWLGKVGLGGAAVGIQRPGVKKLRFQKISAVQEVPMLTQAVTEGGGGGG